MGRKKGWEEASLVSSGIERRAAARIAAAHPRAGDPTPHPRPAGNGAPGPQWAQRPPDRPPPGDQRETGAALDQDLPGRRLRGPHRPAPRRPTLPPDAGDRRGREPGAGERRPHLDRRAVGGMDRTAVWRARQCRPPAPLSAALATALEANGPQGGTAAD